LERAVSQLREGEPIRFERISEYATADLAYIVEFERWRGKVGGVEEIVAMALRVTTIFRREGGEWKIVHRHADPITGARPPESIVEQEDDAGHQPAAQRLWAIDLASGRFLYRVARKAVSASFIAFLEQLLAAYRPRRWWWWSATT